MYLSTNILQIYWLFNEQPVSGKDFLVSTSGPRQVLTIQSVIKSLAGRIACVAENEAGKATCVATLSVIGLYCHNLVALYVNAY